MFIWLFIDLIIEVVTSVIYSPTFIGPAASGLFIYYKSIYISLTQVQLAPWHIMYHSNMSKDNAWVM